jgi:hypothetical protein
MCVEPTLSLGAIQFIILALFVHYTKRSQMQNDNNPNGRDKATFETSDLEYSQVHEL